MKLTFLIKQKYLILFKIYPYFHKISAKYVSYIFVTVKGRWGHLIKEKQEHFYKMIIIH